MGFDGGTKSIQLSAAGEILRFRAEEVIDMLMTELIEYRVKALMPSGLVLTGGGGQLDGLKELAQERLDMPVRVGIPQGSEQYNLPDALKSPVIQRDTACCFMQSDSAVRRSFSLPIKLHLGRFLKK